MLLPTTPSRSHKLESLGSKRQSSLRHAIRVDPDPNLLEDRPEDQGAAVDSDGGMSTAESSAESHVCFDHTAPRDLTASQPHVRAVRLSRDGFTAYNARDGLREIEGEADFEAEFWATVSLPPAAPFAINTHNPRTQDVYISWSAHQKVVWDKFVWDAIKSILARSGSCRFVDVGTNIGYFSLAAAALGCRVVSFEPMSRNVRKVVSSIRRNGFEGQVSLYHNAVGDVPGQLVSVRQTAPTNAGNG
eukprot:CAMPEP_0172193096 /NCGR_PEP_ID=MMETSP1050-20130122/24750_1 /TAXON_ID=233186 /ORGANISM="Cryptomonas curvata, Strain CCAP979/52" /LENGTH=245 /DNA_ID=CAMNT_0012868585 /DNA_START=141 /DNA_END=875 /DNA_ORIENTATION=-